MLFTISVEKSSRACLQRCRACGLLGGARDHAAHTLLPSPAPRHPRGSAVSLGRRRSLLRAGAAAAEPQGRSEQGS